MWLTWHWCSYSSICTFSLSVVENTFSLIVDDIANSILTIKCNKITKQYRSLLLRTHIERDESEKPTRGRRRKTIEFGPFCKPNAKRGMGKKDPLSSSHGITKAVVMSERERRGDCAGLEIEREPRPGDGELKLFRVVGVV